MAALWKKLKRRLVLLAACFLPEERRRALERWFRGREELRRLRRADCVVVSYGKAGRTWLRVMLSHYLQRSRGLGGRRLLGVGGLRRAARRLPRVMFTHDNYIADYTGHADSKADFYDRKVVLLVRQPQDVAVSQFFHWKNRMKAAKKWLNRYPEDEDLGVFAFAMHARSGVRGAVAFMNLWAQELPRVRRVLVVRYEDLRARPVETFRRVAAFVEDGEADEAAVREAVAFGSFENMQALEAGSFFRWTPRMAPRDRANPDSYKVRRAVVGGYRDYLDDAQIREIDAWVEANLAPIYGYSPAGEAKPLALVEVTGSAAGAT